MITGVNVFKEGLEAFHPEKGPEFYKHEQALCSDGNGRLYGYLLFDFKLNNDWDFEDFVIEKSIEVCHGVISQTEEECVKSFVSPVLLPEWVKHTQGHLFLLGLSAVLSFCTHRKVISPRDFLLLKDERYEDIQEYIYNNKSDLNKINNRKVIIVKDDKSEINAFFYKTTKIQLNDIELAIHVQTNDNQYLTILIDKNYSIKEVQAHSSISYSSLRVVKYPNLRDFSLLFPVRVRGSGAIWEVHSDIIDKWKLEIDQTLLNLFKLPYDSNKNVLTYKTTIQSIRLIQLSHHNYQDDFDLSFSLLVCAIEAISTIAIPEGKINQHDLHNEWKKRAESDDFFKKIYDYYLDIREYVNNEIKHKDLSKRFISFILEYYPPSEWEVIDEEEIRFGLSHHPFKINRSHFRKTEEKPNEIDSVRLNQIIKQTYNYRSGFVHEGKSTPHCLPIPNQINRYFQSVYDEKKFNRVNDNLKKEGRNILTEEESERVKVTLINHNLMQMIAKKSIFNFLNKGSKSGTSKSF